MDRLLHQHLQSVNKPAGVNSTKTYSAWGNAKANLYLLSHNALLHLTAKVLYLHSLFYPSPHTPFILIRLIFLFGFFYLRLIYLTGFNQSKCSGTRPCTKSKYFDCNFSVIGPRTPEPIIRPSSSRIGVTSAAVPVKKASSAT